MQLQSLLTHAVLGWNTKIANKLFTVLLLLFQGQAHTHTSSSRGQHGSFAVADSGPVLPQGGGSLSSIRTPCSSLSPWPQLAEQASGNLEASSFLEASWSYSKEFISCPSSLANTYQSERCWVKRHFCQWWLDSPVLLLLSLKDKWCTWFQRGVNGGGVWCCETLNTIRIRIILKAKD